MPHHICAVPQAGSKYRVVSQHNVRVQRRGASSPKRYAYGGRTSANASRPWLGDGGSDGESDVLSRCVSVCVCVCVCVSMTQH